MKKRLLNILLCTMAGLPVIAQNPIVPSGIYIADPSAHVWNDGRLYVYGSTDESPNYYCSHRHDVLVTTDLKSWQLFPRVFASTGENDQVSYSESLLFAPDCQYRDGKWYLYYCMPDREAAEGVAVSTSPTGPFTSAKKIEPGSYREIDPCVFIDDDGQAYYIWGQFTAKMAKLKPNMTEIDLSSIKDSVVTESEHFFHEGGYVVKRKGIYYFVYAHMGRAGMPTCIGYATSSSPMGPYTYGGVIVDNDQCDPGNWNNHGSIVEFNGQWYVFYHRSTHGCNTMRKACMEPITFRPDGSIPEVEMTSQGAAGPLNAFEWIEAERACLLYGNVRIQAFCADNEELGQIKNKDRAAFKYLNFGSGADSVVIRVTNNGKGGKIDLALDMPWRKSIGTLDIPPGNPNAPWQEFTVAIEPVSGIHALWLRFLGPEGELFAVDRLKFVGQTR